MRLDYIVQDYTGEDLGNINGYVQSMCGDYNFKYWFNVKAQDALHVEQPQDAENGQDND